MDEKLIRKLSKQIRLLNIWMGFLSLLVIGAIIGMALALYAVFTTVRSATQRVENIQQQAQDNLDLRKQLCDGDGQVSALLKSQSDICQE